MHCSVDDESLVNLPYVIKLHQESAKIYYSPQPDQSTETHTSKNKEPIDNYCQSCKRLSALSASLADEA